jgi:hypothetical protein
MSDLLNEASLVLIPSGIKASKVYAQIPEDGSGDMTFSRASDATRVNSLGLVEKVRTNMFSYSNPITSQGFGGTLTQNATTSPDGTQNASSFVPNTGAYGGIDLGTFTTSAQGYTFSAYLKGTVNGQKVRMHGDLNGSIATLTLTTNWVRYEATFTGAVGAQSFYFLVGAYLSPAETNLFYIYGAQLEVSDFGATALIPTNGAPVSVGPYSNIPRLNYQNGGGGCPSLLLEAQRTNLAVYSEQFNNSLWDNAGGAVVVANNAISPDGYQNADRATFGASSLILRQLVSGITSSTSYTLTAYVKKSASSPASNVRISVNNTATWSGAGSTKLALTDNWQRITLNWTANGTSLYFIIGAVDENGNADSSCYGNVDIWGAQLEQGSYASSYIPTLGTSVTRVADTLSLATLPNTNMTFTAYLECVETPLGDSSADWFSIYPSSILGRAYGYSNQFGFADAYGLGVTSSTKMVWKQESGSTAKIFKNGALAGTSTTGTYSAPFTSLGIYGANLLKPVNIKEFVFFDNALTDAQCIELTS